MKLLKYRARVYSIIGMLSFLCINLFSSIFLYQRNVYYKLPFYFLRISRHEILLVFRGMAKTTTSGNFDETFIHFLAIFHQREIFKQRSKMTSITLYRYFYKLSMCMKLSFLYSEASIFMWL